MQGMWGTTPEMENRGGILFGGVLFSTRWGPQGRTASAGQSSDGKRKVRCRGGGVFHKGCRGNAIRLSLTSEYARKGVVWLPSIAGVMVGICL